MEKYKNAFTRTSKSENVCTRRVLFEKAPLRVKIDLSKVPFDDEANYFFYLNLDGSIFDVKLSDIKDVRIKDGIDNNLFLVPFMCEFDEDGEMKESGRQYRSEERRVGKECR